MPIPKASVTSVKGSPGSGSFRHDTDVSADLNQGSRRNERVSSFERGNAQGWHDIESRSWRSTPFGPNECVLRVAVEIGLVIRT